MAKPKKAKASPVDVPGQALRSDPAGEAGGGNDAATGAQLAIEILIRDLKAIKAEYTAPMDPELGNMVATYARVLSGIERDGRKGNSLGGKSMEELLEIAMRDPALRDALKNTGHAD